MAYIKRVFGFSLLTSFLCLLSCGEQKLTSGPETSATDRSSPAVESTATVQATFNVSVGSPIDQQTGLRWIGTFMKANPNALDNYYVQASTLKGIMANTACVGISLYYSVDASGNLHIIPIGVDVNGKVIAMQTTTVDNIALSWQTLWQWINNYTGTVRSHFFGTQTFTQLLVDQKSKAVLISRALDDSGNPQLLLSNAADSNPTSYSDESRPCPPYCPSN